MPIIFFMLLFFYVASLNEVHKLIINFSQVISQYAVTPCAAFSLMKIILSVINEKSCFYSIFLVIFQLRNWPTASTYMLLLVLRNDDFHHV